MGKGVLKVLAYLGSGALSALLIYLKQQHEVPEGADAGIWVVISTLATAVVSYLVGLKKPANTGTDVPPQTEIRRGKGDF